MGSLKGEFYRRYDEKLDKYVPTPAAMRQRRLAACNISQLPENGHTWVVHRVAEGLLCSNAAHPAIMIPDDPRDDVWLLTEPSPEAHSPMDFTLSKPRDDEEEVEEMYRHADADEEEA